MNGLILLAAADSPTNMIVIVVGVAVIIAAAWFAYQSSKSAKTYNDALAQLDAERAEFERTKKSSSSSAKPKKTKKSEPKKAPAKKKAEPKKDDGPSKQETELRARLDDARTALDELKQKSYDQTEELKELRARDKAARDAKPSASSDVLFDLRQELGEAKAEVENLKSKLADSRRSGGKKAPAEAPEPEKVEKVEKPKKADKADKTEAADATDSVDVDAIHDDYRAKISALNREKESLERDLRGKLKRSSRDIDRQRRRADNNDKAYKITQRELDASRERLSLLESELGSVAFAANQADGAEAAHASARADAPPEEAAAESTPQNQQNLFDASAQDTVTDAPADVVAESPAEEAPAEAAPAEAAPVEEAVEEAPAEEPTEAAPAEEAPAEEAVAEAAPATEDASSSEEATEEEAPAEAAPEAAPAQEPTEDAPAEEPTEEPTEEAAEEATDEVAAAAASETDIDAEIRRKIEEGTSSLGSEPSSVDEAWADIDLDDDEL